MQEEQKTLGKTEPASLIRSGKASGHREIRSEDFEERTSVREKLAALRVPHGGRRIRDERER